MNEYPSNICGNLGCNYHDANVCLCDKKFNESGCSDRLPPVISELNKCFPFEYTNDMLCPFCGDIQDDVWEMTNGKEDGSTDCQHCGNEFQWQEFTTTTYTTRAKEQ